MKVVINDLSFSYEKKQIFSHCNYIFEDNMITVLLGRNGVGKTTLLNLLAGTEIFDSSISYDNNQKSKISSSEYGYMSDEFFFYKELTVRQTCFLIAKIRDIDVVFFEKDYKKYISLLMLTEYENVLVNDLSFGTKQRLHLFLTIIHNPTVLFLDEPTNGLDPEQIFVFKNLLTSLKKEGKNIIISTHSLKLAEDIADKVVVLFDKKLIEIERGAELEKSYLAMYEGENQVKQDGMIVLKNISKQFDKKKRDIYALKDINMDY
ncbi:ABC transporter [Lactococcus hodotermopsidis]|uniref:ABC transporter n=1 Tax=Pseudolactococcus hodotermopsidis TaxID=2709157 RepID=A0A6A0BCD7_9LACT|nr:ABC transporter ATP-binding protein [Lactococcus hodotermopsidis]GFH42084.1 ABC transporter [Lactococcus hodotermopsidis]